MEAIEAIKTRRSVRQYLPKPVPKEIIEEIVDCGRLAPSANNDQPWEFVVVTGQEKREAIAAAATYGKFIADAPVCLLVFARNTRHFLEDGSAAMENMLIAAHTHGLGTCWIAGANTAYGAEIARICGAPASHGLVALTPLGYSTDRPTAYKRSLEEVIHWEEY
ncbi:MAG: nitroreductase family protein [Clostridia bacterium]|nr:nitroreductase family protein [Clostridia bacterium]